MSEPMYNLSDEEKKKLWDEVCEEFPDDQTMLEVHYVRLLHYEQTRRLPAKEKIQFFTRSKQKFSA